MITTTHYIETKGGEEIPLTITGSYCRAEKQTHEDPGHDAHFEDVAVFIEISDDDEGQPRRINVSEAFLQPWTACELLFDQIHEDNEPDPSDAYKAMRGEGRRI